MELEREPQAFGWTAPRGGDGRGPSAHVQTQLVDEVISSLIGWDPPPTPLPTTLWFCWQRMPLHYLFIFFLSAHPLLQFTAPILASSGGINSAWREKNKKNNFTVIHGYC